MLVLKVKLHSKKQEWGSLAWVFSQLQYYQATNTYSYVPNKRVHSISN